MDRYIDRKIDYTWILSIHIPGSNKEIKIVKICELILISVDVIIDQAFPV